MANRDFNNQVFTDENMVLPLAKVIGRKVPQGKKCGGYYTPATTYTYLWGCKIEEAGLYRK